MPIRAEEKDRYPKDWKIISLQIRERDGNCCKWCKAPNGQAIVRAEDGSFYMQGDGTVRSADTGEYLGMARGSEYPGYRMVRIVLTVAHLDHQPENVADDNLAALCQRCHLRYDARHHASTRRGRRALADLFAETAPGRDGEGVG